MPMKIPYPCACHHIYDRALAFACPYCGLPAVSFQPSTVQEKLVYRVFNRRTKAWWEGQAESPKEACRLATWAYDDCWIRHESGKGGWNNDSPMVAPAVIEPVCPDPLCIVGLVTPGPCEPCTRKKSRGGKRPGAGAPLGNLNHLVHGRRSDLFRHGIVYLVENPDLHYILIVLARFVLAGDFPQATKSVFSQAVSRIKEAHHA